MGCVTSDYENISVYNLNIIPDGTIINNDNAIINSDD